MIWRLRSELRRKVYTLLCRAGLHHVEPYYLYRCLRCGALTAPYDPLRPNG